VHLPASLEVAAEDEKRREESIQSVFEIITLMAENVVPELLPPYPPNDANIDIYTGLLLLRSGSG